MKNRILNTTIITILGLSVTLSGCSSGKTAAMQPSRDDKLNPIVRTVAVNPQF